MGRNQNSNSYDKTEMNLSTFPFSPPAEKKVVGLFQSPPIVKPSAEEANSNLEDIPMIQFHVKPEYDPHQHSHSVVTREDIPMQALNELSQQANPNRFFMSPTTTDFRSSTKNYSVSNQTLAVQNQSLQKELQGTQVELIKAVRGWREERTKWQEQNTKEVPSNIKALRAAHNAEKVQWRSRIAKLDKEKKQILEEKNNMALDYEEKLRSLSSLLMIAKSENKRSQRRRSSSGQEPVPVPVPVPVQVPPTETMSEVDKIFSKFNADRPPADSNSLQHDVHRILRPNKFSPPEPQSQPRPHPTRHAPPPPPHEELAEPFEFA